MDIKCSFLHFIRSTHFLLSQQRQIRGFKEDKRTLNPESLTVCDDVLSAVKPTTAIHDGCLCESILHDKKKRRRRRRDCRLKAARNLPKTWSRVSCHVFPKSLGWCLESRIVSFLAQLVLSSSYFVGDTSVYLLEQSHSCLYPDILSSFRTSSYHDATFCHDSCPSSSKLM